VGKKQDADGFPSHAGDQFSFHGFLDHQTHGPAGSAFRRITTHQSDDPLLLAVVEHSGRARALLFKQGGLQTALLIAMANGTNGLRG